MIRVFVLAPTFSQAQSLAALLGDDERIEVIGTGDTARFRAGGKTALADVLIATGIAPETLAGSDIPAVLLTNRGFEEGPPSQPLRACLPEQSSPSEIVAAITAAACDLMVMTDAQARRWLRPGSVARQSEVYIEPLTAREMQVLRMLADGLANKEIAGQLSISDHTAKFHVAQILAKLGAGSRTEAVRLAIRRGLVPI